MKKEHFRQKDEYVDEMRPEYDFTTLSGGVRGKYYKAYRAGHTVKEGDMKHTRLFPERDT